VEGASDEVHELKLRDRSHTGERSPERRPYNGRFGNWRINDALRAEAVDETVGDFESPTIDSDIFTEAEHCGVALHLLPDSLADGFEVSDSRHAGSLPREGASATAGERRTDECSTWNIVNTL